MKNIYLLLFVFVAVSAQLYAGGMQHNTNHSAQWIRTLSRDASVDIDAVYYNPAGLTKLENGFHIAYHHQLILQERTVKSHNPLFQPESPKNFEGNVTIPVMPSLFVAHKMNKFVFSGGFMMIGGGGTIKFDDGISSIESRVAPLPSALTANGVPTSKYDVEVMKLSKSIAYMGIQAGISYEINDMISVFAGARYVLAKGSLNDVDGSVRNIMINPNAPQFGADYNGQMVSAPKFFTDASGMLSNLSQTAQATNQKLNDAIAAGAGSVQLSNGTALGMSEEQIAGIQQLIGATGQFTPEQIAGLDFQTAQMVLDAAAQTWEQKSAAMGQYAKSTQDFDVEVEQEGSGITPIIGANVSLAEGAINIGMKYEFKTEINLKNKTTVDGSGLFPDGEKNHSDLPAMFSLGVDYKASDKIGVSFGYHQYFDKDANYGYKNTDKLNGKNDKYLNGNAFEFSAGLEYKLTDKLLVSAGYLRAVVDVKSEYQSDLKNSMSSNSIGLGGQYNINDNFDVNFGFLYTKYEDDTSEAQGYKETYGKLNKVFSIGIGYRFLK